MTSKATSNENLEAIYNEKPFLAFSVYTHQQIDTLNKLASEILAILDACIQNDQVDAAGFQDVYGKFWLWVLGSYEVVRTMCDTKSGAADCFSNRAKEDLKKLKGSLAEIRIPFAKQQIRGKHEQISTEASVSGVDQERRDISFSVKGKDVWVRALIGQFQGVIFGISRADVLRDLRLANGD